jgi:hypothetical protein
LAAEEISVSAAYISSEEEILTGEYADGRISDLMMENSQIVVVIGAIGHSEYNARSGGNILDAGTAADRADGLAQVYTHFGDDWPRQAVYDSLEIVSDGTGGGAAVVRAYGSDMSDSSLRVTTKYRLEAGANWIELTTTVTNTGTAVLPGAAEPDYSQFELGDAIAWGDCAKYAPGYGSGVWGSASAPWFAAASGRVSYGYTTPTGSSIWGTSGDLWSHLNLVVADLSPGRSATYTRYLVVGAGDIASVTTMIHEIRNVPVGTLRCSVTSQFEEAPLSSAGIEAIDAHGLPYLEMTTDSKGAASATLPEGTWQLVASAEDHDTARVWISMSEGKELSQTFTLYRDRTIPLKGDTLTVIQRPLLNVPALVRPGDTLRIECDAPVTATGWSAGLLRNSTSISLPIAGSAYDHSTRWWTLSAVVPFDVPPRLYDLFVKLGGTLEDTTTHAVSVIPEFKKDYYIVHITDTHLPSHDYSSNGYLPSDSSEVDDLRAVIADINIINPEFVILTGDLINEGELEDYLNARYYTKAQRLLAEFEVPVFLIAGNHDLGGWVQTPPADGTARRDWWKFFGWTRLFSPPPGAPWYTQNYSFDYGPVHYVALEAYDNYDMWMAEIYGRESFTRGQMDWLEANLEAASGSAAQVIFYHYDFSGQIDLEDLGVEMALWGHIHRDSGNLTSKPYNLSTNNTCDGERSYRLVRVADGTLLPSPTVSAGWDGSSLTVHYEPANDGRHYEVSASIANRLPERFEHAVIRFLMPGVCSGAEVDGGMLLHIEESDSGAVYHVGVDIREAASQSVRIAISPDSCSLAGSLRLGPNLPNPFSSGTILSYTIPREGHVRLSVYDVQGREVTVLVDGVVRPGRESAEWDGLDRNGRRAAPGVYFGQLTYEGESRTRKMVLTR